MQPRGEHFFIGKRVLHDAPPESVLFDRGHLFERGVIFQRGVGIGTMQFFYGYHAVE